MRGLTSAINDYRQQQRPDQIYCRCTASTNWVRDLTPEINDIQHHRADKIYCRCNASPDWVKDVTPEMMIIDKIIEPMKFKAVNVMHLLTV